MPHSTEYLKKRHNAWSVRVQVPEALRERAGTAEYVKALGTTDLAEANRLKHPWVAEFKRRLALLEQGGADKTRAVREAALELRHALQAAGAEPDDGRAMTPLEDAESRMLERASAIAAEQGEALADTFVALAKGSAEPITDLYPRWLAELQGGPAGQTIAQHKAAIVRMTTPAGLGTENEWAGVSLVEEVTRKRAGAYVAHLIAASGLARKTIKRHLSSLSQFWIWLHSRGLAGDNVWLGHKLGTAKGKSKNGKLPYTDADLVKLLSGTPRDKYDALLHDLMRLDLVNGARLDEWCGLKRSDVKRHDDGYWVTVDEGKTDAAARSFPVHKAVEPILVRLLKTSTDDYLFPGLIPGGPDDKRSWYISKAFGRYSRRVGIDDPRKDFHSFRRSFTEACEGAEVPESTVKLIVGHKRESMTYGLYSKGTRVKLRDAVERAVFGPEVMKLLSR